MSEFLESVKRNRAPLFLSGLAVILTVMFLYQLYIAPARRVGPEQPIPFSHRIHAGVKDIQCQFCHPYAGRSKYPGIPPVEKCLYCHKYIIPKHPEIRKEHRYFNTGTSTPWQKVAYVPEHVFFNHERHIRKDVACQQCHGPVQAMDRLQKRRFLMGFCINCHEKRKVNVGCWLACHN